jgi:NitT/TauT family transport system substrate-binding protein
MMEFGVIGGDVRESGTGELEHSEGRSRRVAIWMIALIALAALLAWAYLSQKPNATNGVTAPREKVVVNQAFEHLLYIGLYVAEDKGYFDEEGLDVTIETGGGDAQAFAALSSGSAQFAQGDPGFVAIGKTKGWKGHRNGR